jgi:drug/metabolite transporter (DMT)-like permease
MTSPARLESVIEVDARDQRAASAWLLLACVFWGTGFTWAKTAGETINARTGVGAGASVGPVWVLAVRFVLAAALWLAVSPVARRGWTRAGVRQAGFLGLLLSAAMILQHLGLDRTTAAVSAFLTSLVVVFVPILAWMVTGRRPAPLVWVGVGVATVGVWLMTGAAVGRFGLGEALGLACSIGWAAYIIAIDRWGGREHPARLVAGQFVACALVTVAWSVVASAGQWWPLVVATADAAVWTNVLLLATLATVGSYGILTYHQPKIDPTRASMIYLAEPICAAVFAWAWAGDAMSGAQIAGAVVILAVNVFVEALASRMRVVAGD